MCALQPYPKFPGRPRLFRLQNSGPRSVQQAMAPAPARDRTSHPRKRWRSSACAGVGGADRGGGAGTAGRATVARLGRARRDRAGPACRAQRHRGLGGGWSESSATEGLKRIHFNPGGGSPGPNLPLRVRTPAPTNQPARPAQTGSGPWLGVRRVARGVAPHATRRPPPDAPHPRRQGPRHLPRCCPSWPRYPAAWPQRMLARRRAWLSSSRAAGSLP
jgi:hypothetical protein